MSNEEVLIHVTQLIEGIYKTHKVDFKFVNVVKEILEEIVNDFEALKKSFLK